MSLTDDRSSVFPAVATVMSIAEMEFRFTTISTRYSPISELSTLPAQQWEIVEV
jgi:hypothetical protein